MTDFTTPKTMGAEPLVSSDWNTYVRDNELFLYEPPRCRVYKAGDQTIATASDVSILFDSERYDNDTMHSTSSEEDRITFNTAGIYIVGGCVSFDSNTTGYRTLRIELNGTTQIANVQVRANDAGSVNTNLSISTCYQFALNDYIKLIVRHSKGSDLDVKSVSNASPEFWATWVSS